MDIKETRVFINPDLLKSELGFDALKEYFSSCNTIDDFTMISSIQDGKLKIKSALSGSFSIVPDRFMADTFAISGGYWKMSVESIRKFLGLE